MHTRVTFMYVVYNVSIGRNDSAFGESKATRHKCLIQLNILNCEHAFLVLVSHLPYALGLMTVPRQQIPHQSFTPSLYDIVTENHLKFHQVNAFDTVFPFSLPLHSLQLISLNKMQSPIRWAMRCSVWIHVQYHLHWCQRNSTNDFAGKSIVDYITMPFIQCLVCAPLISGDDAKINSKFKLIQTLICSSKIAPFKYQHIKLMMMCNSWRIFNPIE